MNECAWATPSGFFIQTLLKIHGGFDDRLECWNVAEYHLGHCVVVLREIGEHLIVRYQGVASRSGGREVEVRSVECYNES